MTPNKIKVISPVKSKSLPEQRIDKVWLQQNYKNLNAEVNMLIKEQHQNIRSQKLVYTNPSRGKNPGNIDKSSIESGS